MGGVPGAAPGMYASGAYPGAAVAPGGLVLGPGGRLIPSSLVAGGVGVAGGVPGGQGRGAYLGPPYGVGPGSGPLTPGTVPGYYYRNVPERSANYHQLRKWSRFFLRTGELEEEKRSRGKNFCFI